VPVLLKLEAAGILPSNPMPTHEFFVGVR
jgi:hypothetical protein